MIRHLLPNSLVNAFWHLPKAIVANIAFGFPGKNLTTVGVTGSDGKTTTVTGIYHLLQAAGYKSAMISTVNAIVGNQKLDTGFHVTSPEPWPLQKIIKQMKNKKLTHLVLESTSHGLAQHRLYGIRFEIGVVTNITHEHLDYHKTSDNYLLAKAKLLKNVKLAVLNIDDQSYQPLLKYLKTHNPDVQIWTYGINNPRANFLAKNIKLTDKALNYTCHINKRTKQQKNKQPKQRKFDITFPIPAYFNIYNTLAMIVVAYYLKIPTQKIQTALETFPPVPGRMEVINWNKRKVVIDFAHTPFALRATLETLRRYSSPFEGEVGRGHLKKPKNSATKRHKFKNSPVQFRTTSGKIRPLIISVFGCAGLRDHQKRPMMGKISAQLADITILTAEDPRTEDLNAITSQIAAGCIKGGAKEMSPESKSLLTPHTLLTPIYLKIPDRQSAITTALAISHPGDTIGIFGKGHEQSMCYGTTEHPWSDHKAVQKTITNLANGL